jgi:hypothetical protein
MSRRRFSFEDNSSDQENLDTEERIGDADIDSSAVAEGGDTPVSDEMVDPNADSSLEDEDEDKIPDEDKPIELVDVDELGVNELANLNEREDRKENTEAVEVIDKDGQLVMAKLETALEHFREAAKTGSRKTLRAAAECMQEAQEIAGVGDPYVITVPDEAPVDVAPEWIASSLQDSEIKTAQESLGSTVSSIIKAVLEALRKAVDYLRRMLRDLWLHMRSLEAAIKRRTEELIALRKTHKVKLEQFARAQEADFDRYVQLGRHKAYLIFHDGMPGMENHEKVPSFSKAFTDLNVLLSQSPEYEKFLAILPASCEKFIQYVNESVTGDVDAPTINALFSTLPSMVTLMPKEYTEAMAAHGLQQTDETTLWVSPEYIGNFFQVGFMPKSDFQSTGPSYLDVLTICKVDYTRDNSLAMENDYGRFLNTSELEACERAASAQSQLLITVQRMGDNVAHRLEKLTEIVKKIDAQVWHNNQAPAEVAAAKNKHMVTLARALSSIEGTSNRYFSEVVRHVASVQYAWYSYLTATLKRDAEILRTGIPSAVKV